MSKQEELMVGLARRMFDSEMNNEQCFGIATREKEWEERKDWYLARAYNDLHWLHSQGVVIEADDSDYGLEENAIGIHGEKLIPIYCREFVPVIPLT